jgi:hypothetical protein
MQIRGKTKVRRLVRNTHSGIYYARTQVKGKLQWKTLETDILTVAQARLPKRPRPVRSFKPSASNSAA